MKSIIQQFILTAALLLVSVSASAYNKTFYGQVVVKTMSEDAALVAVSKSKTTPSSSSFAATGSLTQKKYELINSTADLTFYLFAQLVDGAGYEFDGWYDETDKCISTNLSTSVKITAGSTSETIPTSFTYTAKFKSTVSVTSNGVNVTVTPFLNKPGDTVTISAGKTYIKNPSNLLNDACALSYWVDDNGNIVSYEPSFTVVADKPVHYTAYVKPAISSAKGYYRIMSHYNSPLRICGEEKIRISTSGSAQTLYGDLIAIRNPLGVELGIFSNSKEKPNLKRLNALIYDDPGMIIHLQGTLNYTKSQTYTADNEVISNAILSGQGLQTDNMFSTSGITSSSIKLSIKWASADKYNYIMAHSAAAIKLSYDSNNAKYVDNVFIGSNDKSGFDSWRFQPINEEWADTYWFGACPVEEMYYDGGYWSSMYASFPFKCYEPDGVEAYIITELKDTGNQNVAILKKIESGIVPANTAVLLKSRNYVDTYDYFEHGKPIAPQNRLIPLEPDDASVDASVADGNLLSGTFNLFPSRPLVKDGKWAQEFRKYYPDLYDSSKHRIFSVNSKGEVGFYVQANDKGDPEWEEDPNLEYTPILRPNRAYLDLTKVSTPNKALSMRLSTENEAAGIDNIVVDDEAGQADKAIYDIYGRRVEEMVPGNIYIVGGRKILAR